jgi:hypothetical protein
VSGYRVEWRDVIYKAARMRLTDPFTLFDGDSPDEKDIRKH